jgi:hypothetical protein
MNNIHTSNKAIFYFTVDDFALMQYLKMALAG